MPEFDALGGVYIRYTTEFFGIRVISALGASCGYNPYTKKLRGISNTCIMDMNVALYIMYLGVLYVYVRMYCISVCMVFIYVYMYYNAITLCCCCTDEVQKAKTLGC